METTTVSSPSATNIAEAERLAYSIQESADLLGVDYFSVYRLIQRGKLRVPRSKLVRLLNGERVYGISGRSALSDYTLEGLWSAEMFWSFARSRYKSTKLLLTEREKDRHER